MLCICFYRFSTEELRLATGASAPVARKTNVFICFILVLYRFSTAELRLATGASAPVARKKEEDI